MTTRLLFNVAAAVEALTGIAMLIAPAHVTGLLLGDGLSQTGTAVTRVLEIGLLSLGVSAWENARQQVKPAARIGICIYNIGAAMLRVVFGPSRKPSVD